MGVTLGVAMLSLLGRGVEQIPSGIAVVAATGKILYINPYFSRLSGYRYEEVVGAPLAQLRSPGNDDTALQAALATGQTWQGEFCQRHRDGDDYWVRALLFPVTASADDTRHFILVVDDITRERTLKQALEQAYADLKHSQATLLQQEKMASIGQLAAGVAHEINNPIGFVASNLSSFAKYLAKIKEFLQLQEKVLVERGGADHPELAAGRQRLKLDFLLEDCTDLIAESLDGAERVQGIVQGLKNFARLDQAKVEPVDLNACLDSTISIVWNELKYKATLERDYGELPLVCCNAQQLNQVFLNILLNAAQAIEQDGLVQITTRAEGAGVHISIRDNGCGIAPENLGRVFEPFFTTKEVGKGMGLGMSIAYDIVQKHGGALTVDSRQGEGTILTLRLPTESSLAPPAPPV